MSPCADTRLRLFFTYVAATVLDTTALYLIFFPVLPALWANATLALALHLAAFACFVLTPRVCGQELGPDRRFYYYLSSLFVLFLPGVGVAGAFFSCLTSRHLLRPMGLAGEFERRDFLPYYAEFLEDAEDMDAFLEAEINVQPIMDIINGTDAELKRGAIRVLRRRATPEAVHMLKLCLSDSDLEVRFYAHTALSRMEEQYVETIDNARRSASSDEPKDLQTLAEAYETYADSGLHGEDFRLEQLKAACEIYEKIRSKNPDDLHVTLRLGELRLELGDLNAAARLLQEAWQPGETWLRASMGICRLLYERRELPALRGLTRRMAETPAPPADDPIALAHYLFWTAGWNPDADAQ